MTMLKKTFILILSAIFLFQTVAVSYADIDEVLDNLVGGVNAQANLPGYYHGDTSTVVDFGSVSMRLKSNAIPDMPTLNFTPPSMTASCSGFDFDAGSLALLNLDDFKAIFQNMGTTLAWGIMIGIMYSLPGIGTTWTRLNDYARKIQQLMQMGPCAVGQALGREGAGIIKPVIEKAKEKIWGEKPSSGSSSGGSSTDTSPAYKKLKYVIDLIKTQDIYFTFPFGLYTNANVPIDMETLELISSMMGVLDIYIKDTDGNKIPYYKVVGRTLKDLKSLCGESCLNRVDYTPYMPLIESIDDILYGGELEIYRCSNMTGSTCGFIDKTKTNTEGLMTKVSRVLNGYVQSKLKSGLGAQDVYGDMESNVMQASYLLSIIPSGGRAMDFAVEMFKKGRDDLARNVMGMLTQSISLTLLSLLFDEMYSFIGQGMVRVQKDVVPSAVIKEYMKQVNQSRMLLKDRLDMYRVEYEGLQRMYERYMAYSKIAEDAINKYMGNWSPTITRGVAKKS